MCMNGRFNAQFPFCLFCKMPHRIVLHLLGFGWFSLFSNWYAKFYAIIVSAYTHSTHTYTQWCCDYCKTPEFPMKSPASVCDFKIQIIQWFYVCGPVVCISIGLWNKMNKQTIPVELLKWNASQNAIQWQMPWPNYMPSVHRTIYSRMAKQKHHK